MPLSLTGADLLLFILPSEVAAAGLGLGFGLGFTGDSILGGGGRTRREITAAGAAFSAHRQVNQ